MKRRPIFQSGTVFLRLLPVIAAGLLIIFTPLSAQDDYYSEDDYYTEDDSTYFWDDEESGDEYYEDEYSEDEYYEDEYSEDEYSDDEYYDDSYYEEDDSSYYEDEYYDEGEYYEFDDESGDYVEEIGEGELSSEELSANAQRMGYNLGLSISSPGFVNHSLNTYNSFTDFRLAVEMPMLLQFFRARFRIGAEFGTFAFENYMPSGGEYKGTAIFGFVSLPAGPGQVKIGAGIVGGYFGYMAETSYGMAIGNIIDARVGVRATSAMGVVDTNLNEVGTASWLDGLITIGVNF